MKRILKPLQSPPFVLAAVAVMAYGILIPQLGFYWDGLTITWLGYNLGADAITQYYSTNRPAWGVLTNFIINIFPHQPVPWHISALFWRWLSSVSFFAVLNQLFSKQKKLSLGGALLFLIYPGFNQQYVSYIYGYFFIAYSLFLFSIYTMLFAAKKSSKAWGITLLGMLASALNLVMAEYFFVLDLVRPLLLWFALQEITDTKERLKRGFGAWLPYLAIFVAGILGRSLIFNNQVYGYSLLDELKVAPLTALWQLTQSVVLSLWTAFASAWGQAFLLPDFDLQGKVTLAIYIGIITLSFASSFYVLFKNRTQAENSRPVSSIQLIVIGLFAMLLAGVPFWLTGLPVSLGFPANRATLPFIFGSVFVLVGLINLIPRREVTIALLTIIIAFSAGRQFLWADEFRRDWRVHKNLFWQLSWRVPALEENTLVMLNEGALKFYADNSLSAPLNWVYAPDTTTERIPYMVFYPRSRFGVDAENLAPSMPLSHDFIASEWNGNTDQMLLINFDPPGCLHIIDPEIDGNNKFIADLLIRNNAGYSRPELVLEMGTPVMPALYGAEPEHGWCYYYEKADLARQFGNWDEVVRLGKQAFNTGDHPNDPTEYFPFIEGYAQTGDWQKAEELSLEAYRVSKSYMAPMLCTLWARIDENTPLSDAKEMLLNEMQERFTCEY